LQFESDKLESYCANSKLLCFVEQVCSMKYFCHDPSILFLSGHSYIVFIRISHADLDSTMWNWESGYTVLMYNVFFELITAREAPAVVLY
jgi:hypothetical protein